MYDFIQLTLEKDHLGLGHCKIVKSALIELRSNQIFEYFSHDSPWLPASLINGINSKRPIPLKGIIELRELLRIVQTFWNTLHYAPETYKMWS